MQDITEPQNIANHKRAMTLTEIAIAIALVGLSIGGILSIVTQSADLAKSSERAYSAAHIAKNRIERIREIRTDQGYSYLEQAEEDNVPVDANGISDSAGDFVRSTIVDSAYSSNLTKVTVSVKYKRRGVLIPTSVTLVTLVSSYS